MKVYLNATAMLPIKNAVVTFGSFDGIHIGHQRLFHKMQELAKEVQGETVVVTFAPHPRTVITNASIDSFKLLNTQEERIALIKKQGIDHLIIVPFTKEIAHTSADDFITNFLLKNFTPNHIIVGFNHFFGNQRRGTLDLLNRFGLEYKFQVSTFPAQYKDAIIVSSTTIRKYIQECQFKEAAGMLGYSYFFSGLVTTGQRLGHTLGFPTANLLVEDKNKLIPKNGVYAVTIEMAKHSNKLFQGMMNIGNRPTLNGKATTVEIHIFDFDDDIYGHLITVKPHHFFREEQKFINLQALQEQLNIDRITIKKYLHEHHNE
ncbi:MAG: bifunctional riboflavin kinase/FAD synthetase [Phycisphaerales bacterium]|nr:bifunctional riboflavin kinase/FAD synthetase [Phycisphaerales bacterium]